MIGPFTGKYRFLSNFWPVSISHWGHKYPSVEHAYQAAKTMSPEYKERIQKARTPVEARRLGRKAPLKADWDDIKLSVMRELIREKFHKGTNLALCLILTGNENIVELNTWGDTYWGVVNGVGENHLGRLLMERREELIKSSLMED